jgi:hypothetical protein
MSLLATFMAFLLCIVPGRLNKARGPLFRIAAPEFASGGQDDLNRELFLKIGDRQSRKWVAGEARIPASAATLFRLMIKLRIRPKDVS